MGTMERWIQFSKRICVTITMLFIWTTRELECIAIHRFASVRSSSLTISTETRTAVVRQVLRRKTKYVWVGDSHQVESIREKVLRFFNADPEEYTVAFTSGATGALHTIGESFPWSEKSKFYYLAEVHPCRGNHTQSHNSVVGIREYAIRFGGGFRSVDEEEVISLGEKGVDGNGNPQMNPHSSSNPEQTTDESSQETKRDHSSPSENQATFSLFAFPAEDNFAGVKYPLQWIETIHSHGFDVRTFLKLYRRIPSGSFCSTPLPSSPPIA